MKSDKKILIIACLLILVVGASLWGIVKNEVSFHTNSIGFGGSGYTDSDLKDGNYVSLNEEKNFKVEKLSNIKIDAISEDLKVIPTDSEDIKINFYGRIKGQNSKNDPKIFITNSNGEFTAEVKYKNKIFNNISSSSRKIEIYIPKDFLGNVKLNAVSSDVLVHDFKFDNFTCQTVSGDIKLQNLDTNNSEIKTVSGDIQGDKFSGTANFKTTSGDIKINYSKFDNNINGSSVSGEINIQLPEESQFNFDGKSVSGDLNCNFTGNKTRDDKRHLEITVGSSKNSIELSTVSGDMNIYH